MLRSRSLVAVLALVLGSCGGTTATPTGAILTTPAANPTSGAPTATPLPVPTAAPTPTTAASPTPASPTATAPVAASPTPALVTTPSPSSVAASPEPSAPAVVGTIDDFLMSMGISGTARQKVDAQVDEDGTDDFFDPAGGAATLDPGEADLTGNVSFESYLTASVLQGLPACGAEVVCGDKTAPAAGQFAAFLVQMREPIMQVASAGFVVGVVYDDATPLDGKTSEPLKLGKSDYRTGANAEYAVRLPILGAPPTIVRLAHDNGDQGSSEFHNEDTGAFALIRGTVLGIFVPQTEWDGAVGSRFFSSYLTAPGLDVTDTSPETDEDMDRAAAALLASDLPPLSPDLQYFGEATILRDKPISSCEHVFTIEFKVSDSNAQSAIYEGRVIGYQAVVDGPMLNAFVGPGGKAVVTFDEQFTPDGPDCQSHLQPHVRTLDGEGVFG